MKTQELVVRCCCAQEGETIKEIVHASFAAFLKRELKTFSPVTKECVK